MSNESFATIKDRVTLLEGTLDRLGSSCTLVEPVDATENRVGMVTLKCVYITNPNIGSNDSFNKNENENDFWVRIVTS